MSRAGRWCVFYGLITLHMIGLRLLETVAPMSPSSFSAWALLGSHWLFMLLGAVWLFQRRKDATS